MANPYVGFRCPQDVYDNLEKYLKETGQEKSEYLISLIRKELGIQKNATLSDRVGVIEIELKELKQEISKIKA